MKKILLILMLILTLSLSSCTAVKIKRFYEFTESETMDIEICKNPNTVDEMKVGIKFNSEIMIITTGEVTLYLELLKDLVYVDYSGIKACVPYDLAKFKKDDSENNVKDSVSKIKSDGDYLSFELKLDSSTEDEEPETVICKVLFIEKKVESIELISLDNEEIEYTINVNAYGEEVTGLEIPNKEEYGQNIFVSLIISMLLDNLLENL